VKPLLFLTSHAPPDRIGAFAALHQAENVEFALFGGRSKHASVDRSEPRLPFPHRYIEQRACARLIASGRYRAVVLSTGGRLALPLGWVAARRAAVPVILWSSLWAHPRTPAHALSYPVLHRLYRTADAVVTYGPHVSAYVVARGARNVHEAPQAVDNDFWSAAADSPQADGSWPQGSTVKFLFAGRPCREKGIEVLLRAWRASGLTTSSAALVLVGVRSVPPWVHVGGAAGINGRAVFCAGTLSPERLRNFYAGADVLVLPSIATRSFREPWGLVINEAMNQHLPVIASDAVGAVAGGLVRDRANGLVVPHGDSDALARAQGFSSALRSLALSRRGW
jgi:glycosyltransferase involved in cell wall biosynthesis